jgi:hypothetical protein
MSLDTEKFQPTASLEARSKGKQNYSLDSVADTLGTVLASGYLDGTKVLAGDIVTVIHPFGVAVIEIAAVSALGVVTTTLIDGGESGIQALAGAGAADIVSLRTDLTTSSTDAITLADGDFLGQKKIINLKSDGGTPTVTPATAHGFSTVVMADEGDNVTMVWTADGWMVVSQGGLAGGPVVG